MADDNTISINVTATTDDLERGLTKATGEVREFGDGINNLAQRVQAVKPDAFKELAQQFNAGKLDLDEFRDGLIATTTATSAASTEAKALATSTAISSSAMREFTVIGRELASGNLTRLPGSLSLLASRLGGIPPVAILATAAIAAFGYAIYEVVDSSQKFEADLAKIQNAFAAGGSGGAFDSSQLAEFIVQLRQIPGVTGEAASSISNEFARTKNAAEIYPELIATIKPFSELIGKDVPQAAKEMAAAFDDPTRGLKLLQEAGVEVNATSQEQIRQMMAVNDVAGAQRVLFDALNTSYLTVGDTFTSHEYFWQSLRNILGGVSADADRTRKSLEELAAVYPQFAGIIASAGEKFATRNIPNQGWSGSFGSIASGDQKAQAEDQKKLNDAVNDGMQLYDKGNSPLREQEDHLTKINRLQADLNAATSTGNGDAASKIQAQIDQENKLYAERMKRQQPKVKDDDSVDQMMLDDQKLDDAEIEGAAKVGQAKIKTAEDTAKEQYALGQLTADQEAAQLTELAEQSYAIEQARFNQLAILYKDDAAKYEQVTAEKAQAEQRLQQQIAQIQATQAQRNTAMLNQEQQQNQQAAQRVAGPWENAFTEMTTGTRTWQQASLTAARQVETQFVSTIVKNMVNSWVSGELTKTLATMAGNAARTSSDTAAAAGAGSAAAGANKTTIMDDAWTAAANVYNNVSAIPYVGWALAPAAAAAAFAAVAGFGANISSAAGGMIVDSDQIAKVHENEMVLPARYTGGLTKMIDQANQGGAGGSGHTFNNTFHVNGGANPKDIPAMIDAHIKKQARNGAYGSMRTA